MKSNRLKVLLNKRMALQGLAEGYRSELMQQTKHLQQRLVFVERMMVGVDFFKRYRLPLVATVAMMFVVKPIKLMRFGLSAWAAWQSLKKMKAWLAS
jgi:hypothetical protein